MKLRACVAYLVTTSIVVGGAIIGRHVESCDGRSDLWAALCRLDGIAYARIVSKGYSQPSDWPPIPVYFPAYPLLTATVAHLLSVRTDVALLVVTNVCLLGAFIVAGLYLRGRVGNHRVDLITLTLFVMGLWPATVFFRAAYTESMFLFCAVLSLYGMQRRWHIVIIAAIVGVATATRPVGLALTGVFAWYLWQELRRCGVPSTSERQTSDDNDRRIKGATLRWHACAGEVCRVACLVPLASWGLLAYMTFLHIEFGDALAFGRAQEHWVYRATACSEKAFALVALEPLWSPFIPGTATYWRDFESPNNPLLNFGFVNPIVFVLTVGLVIVGGINKWLDSRELVLSSLLLAIPYLTMSYDNIMLSQPRFASVIFPVYLVMARLLLVLPRWIIGIFLLACASLLGIYAAGFAAGWGDQYRVFY